MQQPQPLVRVFRSNAHAYAQSHVQGQGYRSMKFARENADVRKARAEGGTY
jgi:hypothetical protein